MSGQLDLFRPLAPDQEDRDLVTGALDRTLFVEAGAGSGKTTALVGRVLALVEAGVPIGSIAAITFTEKAAAELRHRVRKELTAASAGTGRRGELARAALEGLDLAPIGTLHAFARRLLGEFPVEAQLPPRFAVLDEVQSATAFHERFTDFLEALLDDLESVRLVELCQYDGFGVERGARRMADDFQANWDLVEQRVSSVLPPPTDTQPFQQRLLAACQAVAACRAPEGDRAGIHIERFAGFAARLAQQPTFADLLQLTSDIAKQKAGTVGNSANWKKYHDGDTSQLVTFREGVGHAAAVAKDLMTALNEERRLTLGAVLRDLTLASVEDRRRAGELEFHDLLVFARMLLATDEGVRRQVHQRYTRLLLDEFQDTDPIQLELAVRITAPPADQPEDWRALRPLPGRLTVVGDPKQSIYRFRRADISQFLSSRQQIGADRCSLRANFRSAAPVIEWVNHTMGHLIQPEAEVQPEYEPLVAARQGLHDHGTVTVLGAEAHTGLGRASAETLREREAADVASAVATALADGWPVWRNGELEPCRAGDIAILLPSRLSLAPLQAALAACGVPYRAENSSLVYAAPEVRSLLMALRAADDPTDHLAIVSALRSPLFGCSDRHLAEWKVTHGRRWSWWGLPAAGEELAEHPVAQGLAVLGALAERLRYDTPAQALTWLVRERGVLEMAVLQPSARDVWRRVRFVIDQARVWSEAGGHGVRRYLLWTRLQGDDGRFVAETVLPETDHDAVRIMTVHAAKGLEFPITVVSGLTTQARAHGGRRVIWPPGTWALTDPNDPTYQQFQPVDEQMGDAERRRLLYVACTRACDHLVVSLHRNGDAKTQNTAADWLAEASAGATHRVHDGGSRQVVTSTAAAAELPWDDETEWATQRAADLAEASRPPALGATAIAARLATHPHGAATDHDDPAAAIETAGSGAGDDRTDAGARKDPVDLDLPPWQRGRYGTAIGRAVHAVLQFADLATGDGLAELAAAQAAAEGVLGQERTIERLARSAVEAPLVAGAVEHPHWRELFVAVDLGGVVVEGYIDLLVRHPSRGLLVVDYKTDQVPPGPERDDRLRRYGVQLAAYAVALERLLGEPVTGGVLVMCSARGPAEAVDIPGWDGAKAALLATLATPG